jgi:hypothetical protein
MYQVRITRASEWFNRNVNYTIVLNGEEITKLSNGEEKLITLDLPATIQAKILWCGSEKIDIKENTNSIKEVRIRAHHYTHIIISIVAPSLLLISGFINIIYPENGAKGFFTGILAGLMISCVGLLTIWRDKWLKIHLL